MLSSGSPEKEPISRGALTLCLARCGGLLYGPSRPLHASALDGDHAPAIAGMLRGARDDPLDPTLPFVATLCPASRLSLANGEKSDPSALDGELRRRYAGIMRTLRFVLVPVALVTSTLGCGGAVGEAARPKDHSALGATGGKAQVCAGAPRQAKPLIVDLDPDARVDLEATMKKGIAVVAYDCASFRVLPACKVPEARYEYAGVSRKEQVIQMNSLDDLQVNLPINSGKLGAEMKSGRSIDLALVRVGLTSTPLAQISRAELTGVCEGATHFVQNATLGAFSMATGSVGKVGAVAEMFSVGGSAKSEAERKAMTKDGSLDDCRKSDPDGAAPPPECRAPLQVELFPIQGAASAVKAKVEKQSERDKAVDAAENPCPEGYGFDGVKCTRAGGAEAHLCDPNDEAECKQQCDKGSAESCLNLGRIHRKEPAVAIPLYKKACEGGAFDACGAAGLAMMPKEYDNPKVADEARPGLLLAQKGCDGGSGYACGIEGDYLEFDDFKLRDFPGAMKAYNRGCSLGYGDACWRLAKIYFTGGEVPRNGQKGVELLNKSCQAGNADECAMMGIVHEIGRAFGSSEGVHADPDKAMASFTRACRLDASWCERAAKGALNLGKEAAGFGFAQRGCESDDDAACLVLGTLFQSGRGVSADAGKAKEVYAKAVSLATRACGEGGLSSCTVLGELYEQGKGLPQDADKAKEAYTKGCNGGRGDEDACAKIGVAKKN
jgi:TPR repeat protein